MAKKQKSEKVGNRTIRIGNNYEFRHAGNLKKVGRVEKFYYNQQGMLTGFQVWFGANNIRYALKDVEDLV